MVVSWGWHSWLLRLDGCSSSCMNVSWCISGNRQDSRWHGQPFSRAMWFPKWRIGGVQNILCVSWCLKFPHWRLIPFCSFGFFCLKILFKNANKLGTSYKLITKKNRWLVLSPFLYTRALWNRQKLTHLEAHAQAFVFPWLNPCYVPYPVLNDILPGFRRPTAWWERQTVHQCWREGWEPGGRDELEGRVRCWRSWLWFWAGVWKANGVCQLERGGSRVGSVCFLCALSDPWRNVWASSSEGERSLCVPQEVPRARPLPRAWSGLPGSSGPLPSGSSKRKRRNPEEKFSPTTHFALRRPHSWASVRCLCLIPLWKELKWDSYVLVLFLSKTTCRHLRILMFVVFMICPCLIPFLNSGIFFLWLRGRVLESDSVGSCPGSATSYSPAPCLSFPQYKWG